VEVGKLDLLILSERAHSGPRSALAGNEEDPDNKNNKQQRQ
jgi:hypothetical protein